MPALAEPPVLVPLKRYCDRVPGHTQGSRKHVSTLIRFALRGVLSPAGTHRVKLRATKLGNQWYSTDEWFAEFLAALTTSPTDPDETASRTPAERARASSKAERELIARGC